MAQQLKFVFTSEEAASLGVTEAKDLWSLVEYANNNLVGPPISGAKFGAVGRANSGRIFLGVNIEFSDLPIHYSITAKKFLLANLALNSEKRLLECDIPDTCGPESFNNGAFMLLLSSTVEAIKIHLALSDPNLAGDICSDPKHCSHIKCRALAAADKSLLFSGYGSGVALVDDGGRVYHGWFIEAKRFNLCLGPLKMALVDFVARGEGKGFDKIVEAVLVEDEDTTVSQADTSKLLLEKIAAPHCVFSVLHCYEKPWNA